VFREVSRRFRRGLFKAITAQSRGKKDIQVMTA